MHFFSVKLPALSGAENKPTKHHNGELILTITNNYVLQIFCAGIEAGEVCKDHL